MNKTGKYRLSFTAASLRLQEMSEFAREYREKGLDSITKDAIIKGGNERTAAREFREIKDRINTLTDRQISILADGDLISQKQIALLSICKLYTFIRDFIVEVLRNKALVYDFQVTEGEYITFIRKGIELHPELEELAETTARKIKQVTFKILEQAGMIDSVRSKKIIPQLVDPQVSNAIVEDDPEWLKIFLLSDLEISNRVK
jgi:hypothetical protein